MLPGSEHTRSEACASLRGVASSVTTPRASAAAGTNPLLVRIVIRLGS